MIPQTSGLHQAAQYESAIQKSWRAEKDRRRCILQSSLPFLRACTSHKDINDSISEHSDIVASSVATLVWCHSLAHDNVWWVSILGKHDDNQHLRSHFILLLLVA
jgi:hypothetical protein